MLTGSTRLMLIYLILYFKANFYFILYHLTNAFRCESSCRRETFDFTHCAGCFPNLAKISRSGLWEAYAWLFTESVHVQSPAILIFTSTACMKFLTLCLVL